MKLVVVIAVVLLLGWLLFGSSRRRRDERGSKDAPASGRGGKVEEMLACAHCGVHLPASQALQFDGRSYCGAAHRSAGPRADGGPGNSVAADPVCLSLIHI